MPRVLILECMQEISSFNPILSRYEDFVIQRGTGLLAQTGLNTAIGGALEEFSNFTDFAVVPVLSARAGSAGPLQASSWDKLLANILNAVAKIKAPIDGIYISMHGAMAAETELDPEGALLEGIRNIVGRATPVVISLDLHGILTKRMLSNISALAAYHTYPHVDFSDTGARAARLLVDIIHENASPVIVRIPIPALVRGDELLTETGCYGEMILELQKLERTESILATALLIGNPFTDVPELCSQVIVITNGNIEVARSEAARIADVFWKARLQMQAKLISIDNAVEEAKLTEGSVIFTDAADATSSGASGDSAEILNALIKSQYRGTVLAPLIDKRVAELAHEAGIGVDLDVTLGGSLDHRFSNISLRAKVEKLSNGFATLETSGHELNAGLSAVLISDNLTLLIMSRAVSLFDRAMFFAHGYDPKDFDLTVVKSPYCEYHMFDEWSERNFNVDTIGSTSADISTLGHKHCHRPMYPIDQECTFKPVPEIYQLETISSGFISNASQNHREHMSGKINEIH